MSKVLLLGVAPLPIERKEVLNAPGLRTWQFAKSILVDGHKVCLVCSRTPGAYNGSRPGNVGRHGIGRNIAYHSVRQEKFLEARYIQEIHDRFRPDCIVSASSFLPSYAAAKLKTDVPIWIDQMGDLTAEAQMRAFVEKDNSYLYDFWKVDREILEKGDVFSAISANQRYALIGKLGAKGRLNKEAVGYEFVHVIPTSIDYTGGNGSQRTNRKIIRGKYVQKDDFVILWSGGYNTWTNVDVLFSALEKTMAKSERIKFVSTGGAIPTHNEVTYPHFLELIKGSRFKDRFIMLGWIPAQQLSGVYRESNLGINIDKPCYEAQLGTRTRIIGWMKTGLPVLSTNFCGLTQTLEEKKLGFTFSSEDADSLSRLILKLSSQKGLLSRRSYKAKHFVEQEFTNEKTTKPLRAWVNNPTHSPGKVNGMKKEAEIAHVKAYNRSIEQEYIDNLKWRISNLNEEVKKFQAQSGETEKLYTEIKRLNEGLNKQGKELFVRIEKIKQLEIEKVNLANHCENLKQHSINLENEKKGLEKHIKNLKEEVDEHGREVFARGDRMQQAETEANGLRNRCEALTQYIGSLEKSQDRLDRHIEELKNSLSSRTTDLEKEREGLIKHIGELDEELKKHSYELSIRGNAIKQLEIEKVNLANHCENLKQHGVNLGKEREGLIKHIGELDEELKKHSYELSIRDNAIKQLEIEKVNLANHCENLKQHGVNLEKDRQGLVKHVEDLSNEVKKCNAELSTRTDRINEFEVKNSRIINERDNIKIANEATKEENRALRDTNKDLLKQIEILATESDNLLDALNGIKEEKASLISSNRDLNKRLNEGNTHADILQTKLDAVYATRLYKLYRILTKFKKRPKDNPLCGFYK